MILCRRKRINDILDCYPLQNLAANGGYLAEAWFMALADDAIYIKSTLRFAIPQLVHARLAQPHPFAISAQLVNGPATGIQQYNFGAIHPVPPDPRPRSAARGYGTLPERQSQRPPGRGGRAGQEDIRTLGTRGRCSPTRRGPASTSCGPRWAAETSTA
ncbi:hypothetical protein DL766_005353 [Monosporascus sp. MC13-8B]|uniref:Uncharacterized protein n=1 Tax=Monosporascus cannonballus TaxID=155416 RepID=A0ABY0H914_9PEZI|nr:hypothetical protein DL762_003986 [Monosporascus cannonballus]RYO95119.1 hypothetical protein DL763_003817 [Monosporascus cannonballus]RYP29485.1 hypothetical protein DL766_005353 [Monosporascus sp. MC13-8B]